MVKESLGTKKFNLDTSNNGESEGKNKRVLKGLNWFKSRYVFDERLVPRKSEYECTDKDGKDKEKNFSYNFVHFFSVGEISEHFINYQYFFL